MLLGMPSCKVPYTR